jgi:hypothetical protein
MITKQHIEFLRWLKTRLCFKHNDTEENIQKNLDQIISIIEPKPFVINKRAILKVCEKLYPTFDFIKDEDSFFDVGYSKKEKIEILNHATQIVSEYFKLNK